MGTGVIEDVVVSRAHQALEAALAARRESISRELCTIPPPVPACDVHFNRLLEERGRVVDALQRLAALRTKDSSAEALLAFCDALDCVDADVRGRIEALLAAARGEGGRLARPVTASGS